MSDRNPAPAPAYIPDLADTLQDLSPQMYIRDRLLSPSKHVAKTYYARIDGEVTWDDIIRFKEGIDIGEERPTKPCLLYTSRCV